MKTRVAELAIIAAGAAVIAAIYLHFGLRLAQGYFLDHWNLAFDLDPGRLVDIFTKPEAAWPAETLPPNVAVKHPLLKAMNGLCGAFPLCANDPKAYATTIAALHGVASSLLMFVCLRLLRLPLLEATLATAIFAVSAAQLFNAMIVESYVLAGAGIAAFLTLNLHAMRHGPGPLHWLRLPLAVHLFGITTTNVVIGGIADLAARAVPPRRPGWWQGFLLFWCLAAVAAAAASLLVWPGLLGAVLSDPIASAKEVYWAAPHDGSKSLSMVLKAFYPFAIVAPDFTTLVIDSIEPMRDFRDMRYGALGWLLVAIWAAAFILGLYYLATDRRMLRLFAPFLAVILFNTAFHVFFQYRHSVFLYVTHVNFSVFLVSAAALLHTCRLRPRLRYLGCIAAALFLIALTVHNAERAAELAAAFG